MINLDAIDLTDYELYRHGFPHELFTSPRKVRTCGRWAATLRAGAHPIPDIGQHHAHPAVERREGKAHEWV